MGFWDLVKSFSEKIEELKDVRFARHWWVCVRVSVWLSVRRRILEQQSTVAAASFAQHHDKLGTRRRRLVFAAYTATSVLIAYLLN